MLSPKTPLARFSTAKKSGTLSGDEDSPLSGSAGAALEIWMRLNERATDSVREPFVVLQYGDSHSQGGTFADQFRQRLSHQPISPGLVSSGFPMNWGVQVTKSGKWKRRNWLRDSTPSFGPLGIVFDSHRPKDELRISWGGASDLERGRISVTVVFDARRGLPTFDLRTSEQHLLSVPGAASEYAEQPEHIVVDEESGLGRATIQLGSDSESVTLVSGTDTAKERPLSVYGFLIRYEKASLEWHNFGVSGTEIKHLLMRGDDAVESYLKWIRPDLFVAWFGTNSLNDPTLTVDGYRDLYRTYLNRLARAMPQSTCLVVGPPDFMKRPRSCFLSSQELRATKGRRTRWKRKVLSKNRRLRVCTPEKLINHRKRGRYRFPVPGVRTMKDWRAHRAGCEFKTVPLMEEIIAVQKTAAHEAGCLYFDAYKFMGGSGGIHRWACRATGPEASLDHIHLNSAGYRKLADGIVDELNRALERLTP